MAACARRAPKEAPAGTPPQLTDRRPPGTTAWGPWGVPATAGAQHKVCAMARRSMAVLLRRFSWLGLGRQRDGRG